MLKKVTILADQNPGSLFLVHFTFINRPYLNLGFMLHCIYQIDD